MSSSQGPPIQVEERTTRRAVSIGTSAGDVASPNRSKTAATAADRPTDSSFVTLDEDGTACSSDYYLRLTGDGGKMLRKAIPFTFTRPTLPQ